MRKQLTLEGQDICALATALAQGGRFTRKGALRALKLQLEKGAHREQHASAAEILMCSQNNDALHGMAEILAKGSAVSFEAEQKFATTLLNANLVQAFTQHLLERQKSIPIQNPLMTLAHDSPDKLLCAARDIFKPRVGEESPITKPWAEWLDSRGDHGLTPLGVMIERLDTQKLWSSIVLDLPLLLRHILDYQHCWQDIGMISLLNPSDMPLLFARIQDPQKEAILHAAIERRSIALSTGAAKAAPQAKGRL